MLMGEKTWYHFYVLKKKKGKKKSYFHEESYICKYIYAYMHKKVL